MSLIVQKFGGTSVRDAERVMNVARIVTDTYAKGNDVIHQLIDLALLQNGMLTGQALDTFVKRSVGMIKE